MCIPCWIEQGAISGIEEQRVLDQRPVRVSVFAQGRLLENPRELCVYAPSQGVDQGVACG